MVGLQAAEKRGRKGGRPLVLVMSKWRLLLRILNRALAKPQFAAILVLKDQLFMMRLTALVTLI